jgi:hypothetical protein
MGPTTLEATIVYESIESTENKPGYPSENYREYEYQTSTKTCHRYNIAGNGPKGPDHKGQNNSIDQTKNQSSNRSIFATLMTLKRSSLMIGILISHL